MSLKCVKDGDRLKCLDTRSHKGGGSQKRIYICPTCNERYTTVESMVKRMGHGVPVRNQFAPHILILRQTLKKAFDQFERGIGLTPPAQGSEPTDQPQGDED